MVDYLPRSAWNARPPNGGPGLLTVSRVEGAVIHWPGTSDTDGIHTKAEVASALRGWQNYHMDDRGWSDIAYQIAVDQAGRAWTLRGLRTQSGANGNNDLNERYGAILLVLVTGEQPTAAMKATTRGVIADFRRIFPRGTAIRPHSAVRPDGTDCPGPAARAALARGDFTPGVAPTPPPPEDDMPYTPDQIKQYAGVGVHGQKIGRSDVTIGLAIERTMKNSAAALVQVAALTAAVKTLAETQGLDAAALTAQVHAAVDAALSDLKVTLTVDDEGTD